MELDMYKTNLLLIGVLVLSPSIYSASSEEESPPVAKKPISQASVSQNSLSDEELKRFKELLIKHDLYKYVEEVNGDINKIKSPVVQWRILDDLKRVKRARR